MTTSASLPVVNTDLWKALYAQQRETLLSYYNSSKLNKPWPIPPGDYHHRSEKRAVPHIHTIKQYLHSKLGAIPVYFFLTEFWGKHDWPGAERNVEKGLMYIYSLCKGV